MSEPHHCPRCNGAEFQVAGLEAGAPSRVVVDATHSSPLAARVCLACGHVELTATQSRALRLTEAAEKEVQEYDF